MTLGAVQSEFKCKIPIDFIEEIEDDTLPLFSFLTNSNKKRRSSSSITDYGNFSFPEVHESESKDIRKVSMTLQINLEIIEIGWHSLEYELFDDVNAIILVIDSTNKQSISDAVDKYEKFLKDSTFKQPIKKCKKRRNRSRTRSNPKQDEKREFIPIIVAMNKSECESASAFSKDDAHKILTDRLEPIISANFPESDAESDDAGDDEEDEKSDDLPSWFISHSAQKSGSHRISDAMLVEPPNLSVIYDQNGGDVSGDDERDDMEQKNDFLSVREVKYHRPSYSDMNDPFNTPKTGRSPREKNDIRRIDIICCSAKSGENIERLFESCIKKTIPLKLSQSVSHKRTKTTAFVTAPIWLRKVVSEFQENQMMQHHHHPHHTSYHSHSSVNDNFLFLDESDEDDID